MGRIFSAIQPTGSLHLGNYLGAIRNWVDLQEIHESFFCIVDLHALTLPQNPIEFKFSILEIVATYLACGIDPKISTIFVQSSVPAHSELSWLLSCYTPIGWLNRMTQFKEKSGKFREKVNLGLYSYPVLMAADILLYKATHVPVGEDQKQHLELTRDIARLFNSYFKKKVFSIPSSQILGNATRVMSLRGGAKMSKSDLSKFSRIHLLDNNDIIALKVWRAKTDSYLFPETIEDLLNRPEIMNLVNIYSVLTDLTKERICERFAGQSLAIFKSILIDILISVLSPISIRIREFQEDSQELEKILKKGAEKANFIAKKTLYSVYEIIGLIH